jgi:amino acid transporter
MLANQRSLTTAPQLPLPNGDCAPELARTLGPVKLVALIIASAAPLACLLGTVPLLFAFGFGPWAPETFLATTAVLLLFSVGYAQICQRVTGGGALYTYVACGLGSPWGVGAAFVAVSAYLVFNMGNYAYTGYFAHLFLLQLTGLDIPWYELSAFFGVLVGLLGYRQLDVSARLILVLLVFEFGLIALFDGAVLIRSGLSAFTLGIFQRSHSVPLGALSIGLMYAFLCYIGFESAAIYSQEVHRPTRSIPIALFAAVLSLGGVYILTTWLTIGLVGAGRITSVALADPPQLYLNLNTQVVGHIGTYFLGLFVTTSMFVTTLALHNAATRYLYSLGRHRCFPAPLGVVHSKHHSPHIASLVASCATAMPAILLGIAGVPPIVGLGSVTTALGTIGILMLQSLAALSIVVYFARLGEVHWWKTVTAPLSAAFALAAAAVLATRHFALLSGTSEPVIAFLPWLLVVTFGAGFLFALRARVSISA